MSVTVTVTDMTCQGCESVVETAVELLDGVATVEADRYDGAVEVTGDIDPDDIVEKIELAGYTATTAAPRSIEGDADSAERDATDVSSKDASADGDEPVRDFAEETPPVEELAEDLPGSNDGEAGSNE